MREKWPEADVTMIPSGGGVFEVSLGDALLFSKKQLGRHAQPGEILGLIQDKL
jgi:selenoprotein W-related protein